MCRYLAATQTVSEVLSDRRTDENEAARVMAAAARPMARGTNFFAHDAAIDIFHRHNCRMVDGSRPKQ